MYCIIRFFFDTIFGVHGKEIYTEPQWPANPLFYVSVTSVTDNSAAPQDMKNLFFLIPVCSRFCRVIRKN